MLIAKLKGAVLGVAALVVVTTGVSVLAQTGPSDDDRLKAVERKLDRLLELFGKPNHPPAITAATPASSPAPLAAPAPDQPPNVPPPPVPGPAGVPPADPGTPTMVPLRGYLPPAVTQDIIVGMAPGSPRGIALPTQSGPQPPSSSVGGRISALENRLGDLERRIADLEHRLPPIGHDVRKSSRPRPFANGSSEVPSGARHSLPSATPGSAPVGAATGAVPFASDVLDTPASSLPVQSVAPPEAVQETDLPAAESGPTTIAPPSPESDAADTLPPPAASPRSR